MESSDRAAAFGPWLQRRRRMLGLTQKAFARRVGCSVAAIRKFEYDERKPSIRMARALAAALAIPADERDAFIHFARAGWADRAPQGPPLKLESPWLDREDAVVGQVAAGEGLRPPETPVAARKAASEPAPTLDRPRIVAREAQLARLERELDQALACDGCAMLIAGEAGQGKTALITAFATRAQAAHPELIVAVGTCNAYTGQGDPFLPFRQLLAQLTGDVPASGHHDAYERERMARLGRLMPQATRTLAEHGVHLFDTLLPLRPLRARLQRAGVVSVALPRGVESLGPAPLPLSHPGSDQLALRAETAASLVALADQAPLLLVLDDLQWLDDSSAELLLHLARAAPGHRLLVLGAFRPAELPASVAGQRRPHPLHELTQGHSGILDLDKADGRAFVDAWLDTEANALDEEFRAALTRQTAGHPLFTIELLRAMQERGDLVLDDSRRWVASDAPRWDQLPTRISEALVARLECLSSGARDVLRAASIEGETFTAEVVARTLALEPRRVVRILATELDRSHRLVSPVDVERGPAGLISRYRFRHDLIQRFVYGGIDPSERAYLHEGTGAALEELLGGGADPVALARHYALAQAPERAAPHHRRAGDRARKAHAPAQAIEHYRAALEHWANPDPIARAGLQLDLGQCQWLRMQLEDARRNLSEACTALEAAGDVRSVGSVQVVLSMLAADQSDHAGASSAARRAVTVLEPAGDSPELAAALSNMGYVHLLVSEFDVGAAWGARAVAMAERVGAASVLPHALFCLGSALPFLNPPRIDEGIALLERSIRLANEQDLPFEASMAAANLGDVLEGVGRHADARERFRTCLAHAERHQIAHGEQEASFRLWWLAWTHGDWTEAFARVSYVRRLVEGVGADPGIPYAVWLASSELDLGHAEEVRTDLDRQPHLHDLARPSEHLPHLGVRLRAAVALGDQSEADRAAVAIAEAVGPTPPALEYDAIVPVLEALRHLASRASEKWADLAAGCLNALGALERRYGSPEAQAALLEGRAVEAARLGSMSEAARLWIQAAEQWRTGTFPLREARCRAAAARTLERTSRSSECHAQRERARALFDTLSRHVPEGELRSSFVRVTSRVLEVGDDRPP